MIQSEQLGDLLTALSAFQGAVESVAKGSENPFYKSRYAALPDVVKAAAPLLVKHGLAVTQHLGHDEAGDTLTTIVGHKSGQFMGDTMHLRPVKDDPQAQGSAVTYGRRYAYMAALGLVADEDDDGNAGSQGTRSAPSRKAPAANGPIGKARARKFITHAEGLGVSLNDLGRALSVGPTEVDVTQALATMTKPKVDGLLSDMPMLPANTAPTGGGS